MSSEVLVRCDNVGKKFCRDLKKSLWYGIKDSATDLLGLPTGNHATLRDGEFWANKGINFELRRGDCLGLIGRNGAGKTTLLKMLNGLIKPDCGEIMLSGRVGGLIALGAGFNPILTGRENIYANGSILGLSRRQIDDHLDNIVEFSALEDFIDTPVRSYSSGMQVRLGFAVASTLSPDVLLIDEVLAVGDAAFRSRCFGRIAQLLESAAVVFVSHNMQAVANICARGIVLQAGEIVFDGNIDRSISSYEEINTIESTGHFLQVHPPIESLSLAWKNLAIGVGDPLCGNLIIKCDEPIEDAVVRIVIFSQAGVQVAELGSEFLGQCVSLSNGINKLAFEAYSVRLRAGTYKISVCVSRGNGLAIIAWDHLNTTLRISGSYKGFGGHQLTGEFCLG